MASLSLTKKTNRLVTWNLFEKVSGRKTGEEERHGRLWEEGRQSRRNPGGCIPTKGCVHEYGTVSPAATWFSTWRGTAPVK